MPSDTPRVLTVVSPTFHPEPIGTPLYATDMAQWFASRGWRVRVVTAQPFYPKFERYPGYGRKTRHDRLDDIEILRLPTIVPAAGKPAWRAINELNFAMQGLLRAPGHRSDAVISISPGVPWAAVVGRAFTKRGGTHIALVHDIQSGLAEALGLGSRHLAQVTRANERASLQRADRIVVLTDEMGEALRRLGVTRPIDVVPVWATVDPSPELVGAEREMTVQYSGNFGEKQAVGSLLDLADQLRILEPECDLLLRGEGERVDQVRAEAARRQITNVRFEDPVPQDELAAALAKSPVHVVMQAAGSAPYVMPSKVVNALACGCSVVAMADATSPLVRLAARVDGLTLVDIGAIAQMADAVAQELRANTSSEVRVDRANTTRRALSREQGLLGLETILLDSRAFKRR